MSNRGVTFHPDPRLLLLSLPLQLPACPPGGFSSLSALGRGAYRRLGEASLFAPTADARKVHRWCVSSFQKRYEEDLFLICDFICKKKDFGRLKNIVVFLFYSSTSISTKGCTSVHFLVITFVRAVHIFNGIASRILFVSDEKRESTQRI